ncbi:PREDICTED: aldehyde oxidase GLOX1-like [Ipomoea nil]|uniref:aldehyde oxidase GLOX1-like n=1 Tax=Ipomoea nil TaxID=35883 RepID=UPI000901A24F|nr:PREDICTED: aldehyde oxidase GLOX1-like [Ipomoea nil]
MNPSASSWQTVTENVGVSAMHMQLMTNNRVVWYDAINLGRSALMQNPKWCRKDDKGREDCWAHGVTYDLDTAKVVKTLKLSLNTWCSSGGLSSTGKLISTGGYDKGFRGIRILEPCDLCDFKEDVGLSANRWYASQQVLENGDFIVVGGRKSHNYEIVPPDQLKFPNKQFPLRLLEETTDGFLRIICIHLCTSSPTAMSSSSPTIAPLFSTLEPERRFGSFLSCQGVPELPGLGQSALLPLKLTKANDFVKAEVLVCGGNTHEAFKVTEHPPRQFPPALKDCGRIVANQEGAKWEIEEMPSGRVMGDMLILPDGNVLIINGAKTGTSGWDGAEETKFHSGALQPG